MDENQIHKYVIGFIRRHKMTLDYLGGRQSQILELSATVGVVQHYKAVGYNVEIVNPVKRNVFRVKLGTRGHPSEYSKIICKKNRDEFEIHSNISVRGAHDDGIYCVDVGILKSGVVPDNNKQKWIAASNKDLISFLEAKRLVIYPMLLAQFIGIVHEIKPKFILKGPIKGFGIKEHIPPTLIALGHFSSNSKIIVDEYVKRNIQILIVDSYDIRVSMVRRQRILSPFDSWTNLK